MSPRPSLYVICLTCEDEIRHGEVSAREPGIGAWHLDCGPPRNLALYRRERERGKPDRGAWKRLIQSADSLLRA